MFMTFLRSYKRREIERNAIDPRVCEQAKKGEMWQ
jgi:hypothetical protein